MNKARKEAAKELIKSGHCPQAAYEIVKLSKSTYAHAVWVKGALVRKDKAAPNE